ncbi:H-NS family nucleoid-associated regulatory protein [Ruegeria sp. HKCCD8929]|uniref:H-NS histone family protein n=1 Tax=Ruegeria sp. HKCCD8929 TaxID=2683006 RepID=UPI0020C5382B|nr:H-NS histone family protein [Ruegeria sp. HKCCD8929]
MREDVDAALGTRRRPDLNDAKAAKEAAAGKFGFSLADLVGKSSGRAKSKAAAKYRNPDNPVQTWTGRERKPQWVIDALAGGADITALEI